MRRMLTLALSLVGAKKGLLLYDEIDTGLHYSVMSDMWKLVVRTAIQNNVQVFATTHSLDCLKGLAQFCERNSELASNVTVQSIDPELERSVALNAGEIVTAEFAGIEVR